MSAAADQVRMESCENPGNTGAVRPRVLLVEDDDLDVSMFLRAVGRRDLAVEVQRARNAVEAFEMLRLQHEEGREESMLIVLDLNMPAMHGIEFLEQLRADPDLKNSVVIVFSTSSSPCDVRKAYEHHVAGYLTKDVVEDSTAKLVDFLANYLEAVRLPGIEASVV